MRLADPVASQQFGLALRAEMDRAGVNQPDLARAAGTQQSHISAICRGALLPSLEVGARLADALIAPRLLQRLTDLRKATCPACRRTYVRNGGLRQVYCSVGCRMVNRKSGGRFRPKPMRPEARAIALMCRSCEPLGLCRDRSCPLRPFSPLPLAERISAPTAFHRDLRREAWSGEHGEARRARLSERMKALWDDPDERARRAASNSETWAAATPEQRAAHRANVSAGRRRSIEAA